MSFEAVVDLSCPVKVRFPTEEMAERLKSREQGEGVLAMARRKGDTRPPGEIRIRRRIDTPGGSEERSVSLAEMIDAVGPMEVLAHHCDGCPANAAGRPFGCYGRISYPIRAATEGWLLDRLPARLDSTAGRLLVRSIRDLKFDGKPVAALRGQGPFFESSEAASRSWGSWPSRTKLTSDQILQMILCVGTMLPSHALMLCLFLGRIPHDAAPGDFEAALSDHDARRRLLDGGRLAEAGEEGQVGALALLIEALATAAALDVPLRTSY